jgi:hypothetical protein
MSLRLTLLLAACAGGLITVLPAGAAQSASGGEQATKFYELLAFSATSDAILTPRSSLEAEGRSHTRAQLTPGKRYTGGFQRNAGHIHFKLNAAIDERFRSRSYSCEESFQRTGYPVALRLLPGRKGFVNVLLHAPYVRPGLRQVGSEYKCNRFFGLVGKQKTYSLRMFTRRKFTLSHSGEQRFDLESGLLVVRYTTRFVLKPLR